MKDLRMPTFLVDKGVIPLSQEKIPDKPPEPKASSDVLLYSQDLEWIGKNVHVLAYLSYHLIEYAWHLAEMSWERRGGYDLGFEVPSSCRAAGAGAIALAYGAVEAGVNELLVNLEGQLRAEGDAARGRLAELAIRQSMRDRLDAVAAILGHPIEWGSDQVFQHFDLLAAVRNHLLHHELGSGPLAEGYWPAKRLRDLPKKITSPYVSRGDLHWFDHVLAPAGAIWAVNTACEVLSALDKWWDDHRVKRSSGCQSTTGQDKPSNRRGQPTRGRSSAGGARE